MAPPLPKLSYVLLSHNRERYIRAAIESAFAQEYEGELEYIFSDDCSTDNTYAIIQECVANYRGGRRVIVTQTPANCHLAEHTNHAVSFAESDWIIRADDDDYSSVDRCALIGRAIATNPDCRFVATGVHPFSDQTDYEIRQLSLQPCGEQAVFRRVDLHQKFDAEEHFNSKLYSYKAWHRDVYQRFGALDKNAYYVDDLTCYRRAHVLGSGIYIENAPLVFLREGSGNMSLGGGNASRGYHSVIRLEKFNDKYFNLTYTPLLREWEQYGQYVSTQYQGEEARNLNMFLESIEKNLAHRKRLCSYWRNGTLNRWHIARKEAQFGFFEMLRCLPLPLYAGLLTVFRFFKDRIVK